MDDPTGHSPLAAGFDDYGGTGDKETGDGSESPHAARVPHVAGPTGSVCPASDRVPVPGTGFRAPAQMDRQTGTTAPACPSPSAPVLGDEPDAAGDRLTAVAEGGGRWAASVSPVPGAIAAIPPAVTLRAPATSDAGHGHSGSVTRAFCGSGSRAWNEWDD